MSGFFEVNRMRATDQFSEPAVTVLEEPSPSALRKSYGEFRDKDGVHVLAFSPASLTVGEASYPDGSGRHYAYLMTVVYQARLLPNGPEGGDE